MPSDGVGGLSVADGKLFVTGRDASDQTDLLICLDGKSGNRRWTYSHPAPADLDYGNSPRATPTIQDGVVVHLGATGQLVGLDESTGVGLWSVDLPRTYGLPMTDWGFCGSPLVDNQTVYLQVAESPSLVALDLFDGKLRWTMDEQPAAYSSLVLSDDGQSLFGVSVNGYFECDVQDGRLRWSANREISGDFGVPAPVLVDGGVAFIGENNGVLYKPTKSDRLKVVDDILLPDSHTPVAVGNDLLIAFDGIHRVRLPDGKRIWSSPTSIAEGYASLIASPERAMVIDQQGEVFLVDLETGALLDQASLSLQETRVLSHPAIAEGRMWVRVGKEIRCYSMSGP